MILKLFDFDSGFNSGFCSMDLLSEIFMFIGSV